MIAPPGGAARCITCTIHGYSPYSAERIVRELEGGARIVDLPGDFTVVAEGKGDGNGTAGDAPFTRIITSLVASRPYYFTAAARPVAHGQSVFDVVRDARLPWRWNRRAVACLALFGHTLGEDTLHPDVMRAPSASVITLTRENVRIDTERDAWPSVFSTRGEVDNAQAIAVLEQVFGELAAPDAVISLSAGFDSRLLLALALRAGHRPTALTMGFPHSTDVVVARQLSAALGLDHQIIELEPDDYFAHARDIVAATSGVKTAGNWHTDLYVRAAGLSPGTVHYVGANGELARSFYFDRGLVAIGLAHRSLALFRTYWTARLLRRARRFPAELFGDGVGPIACARLATELVRSTTETFMDALDCFYVRQRVRHFIGNGLALYAKHGAPRSPFLDARWIRAVTALPRAERLGSNHHRAAVASLAPQLLSFPVGTDGPMERRAPAGYHVRRQPRAVGYSPFEEVLADRRAREIIVEANGLDGILARPERIAASARGGPTAELLLTLAFAAELGHDATPHAI